MKTCNGCGETKPLEMFSIKRRNKDGRQSRCKLCSSIVNKGYYQTDKGRYARNAITAKQKNTEMLRRLKEVPCADCGLKFPYYVMDFDHLDGSNKVANVALMVNNGFGRNQILAEVAKCEVVCANCHRERTHRRRVEGSIPAGGTYERSPNGYTS